MRIGLFGGTFNPVHSGHLLIAAQVRDRLNLARVLFIPTGDPPHKPPESLAPAAHRSEMVRLAVDSEPTFTASDIEVRRAGKSYTIETVQMLRTELGASADLFFILGLDSFLEIATWRQVAELLKLCHFVVVSRPGARFLSLSDLPLLPATTHAGLESLDAGTTDEIQEPLSATTKLILLRLPLCPISASEIRRRLKAGESLATLLPPPVESYIIRHGLFRGETDRTRL